MSDLKLDDSGNLAIENGGIVLTLGVDAIVQHVRQRLKTFYGEYFLDSRRGVPWFQQILKKGPDPVIIDSILKRTIVLTPGIIQLTKFDATYDKANRTLSVTFKAKSEEGPIDFSEEVP